MTATAAPPTTRLGRSYQKLFAATTISNLGDGMATIAYPWLASAITRNPLLIALVAVAQRLPWLVFTLPAGVITDRVDRRRAMVAMDALRFALTLLVAFAVLGSQGDLPGPDEVDQVVGTQFGLFFMVLLATLLLGHGRGAARQLRPDVHAVHRREPAPRACQRAHVERRDDHEHLRRATPRISAARRGVRTAVLRRRRVVLRVSCPDRVDPWLVPRGQARRASASPLAHRTGRRSSVAARPRTAVADGDHPGAR